MVRVRACGLGIQNREAVPGLVRDRIAKHQRTVKRFPIEGQGCAATLGKYAADFP
jgi:hypothetical protein